METPGPVVEDDSMWFIDFDSTTLQVVFQNEQYLLDVGQQFAHVKIQDRLEQADMETGHYLLYVGDGMKEIVKTLYNFFIVQEKLSDSKNVKRFFRSLVSLLRTQISYTETFRLKSETFIYYRIMACLIRSSKFYKFLYYKIQEHKSSMDKAFFQNMKEVYLYTLQKFRQMLMYETETRSKTNVDKIRILIIHQLNVLTILFGYPVKDVVFNQLVEEQYVNQITRYNMYYYQFKTKSDQTQTVQVEMEQEVDPALTGSLKPDEEV